MNWADPWGLWSVTIDFYTGFGGGIVFGQNDDGSVFLTARGGIGKGGGLSYSPTGGSPGYDPCQTNQDFNAYLGFFAEAAAELGPGKIGAGKQDGLHSKDMVEAYPYRENNFVDPGVVVPGTKGARLGASIGIEGGFVWKH